MENWFYSRDGKTYGPFASDEIKAWVARGVARAGDCISREGNGRESAMPALAALDFGGEPKATNSLPDWLADVAKLQTTGPIPPPQANPEPPDWLSDLRLWYGLEALLVARLPGAPGPSQDTKQRPAAVFEVPPSEFLVDGPAAAPAARPKVKSKRAFPVALAFRAPPSLSAEPVLPAPSTNIPDWLHDLLPETQPLPPPQQPATAIAEPLVPAPSNYMPDWLVDLFPETKPLLPLGESPSPPTLAPTSPRPPMPSVPPAPLPSARDIPAPDEREKSEAKPSLAPTIPVAVQTVPAAPPAKTTLRPAVAWTKLNPAPVD